MVIQRFLLAAFLCAANLCTAAPSTSCSTYQIFDQRALQVLDTNAPIEELASGFAWTEGPVWVEDHGFLLFSDIPNKKIFKYTPGKGVSVFLEDSGYSNGLVINHNQQLILMQSRFRQIAKMSEPLGAPRAKFEVLASRFEGKKLNSPNDAALHHSGVLFFSDPPYGLPKSINDPTKELPFQGIYALKENGNLSLLDKSLNYPNGVALSPDQKRLYIGVSDIEAPAWYVFDLDKNLSLENRRIFYKVESNTEDMGLPDGLKFHSSGILFATGPEGLWLFDEKGKLLAKVRLPSVAANLAFDKSESRVYITAHKTLLSIKLRK